MSIFLAGHCRLYRRFSSAVSYRYPLQSELLSAPAPRTELMSNADCRPEQLCATVALLTRLGELDTAAEYACLAYSKGFCDETRRTCQTIIKAMCEAKRYREALDLYHYFFNELKMQVPNHSSGYITQALCELGRVDDALALIRVLSPNASNNGELTKALVHAGRFEEALSLLRKYPVSSSAYTNLIGGYLNLGNLYMANQLLEEFESNCGQPGDYNCESGLVRVVFVEHWFKQGKDEEAMRCYHSLLADDRYKVFGATGKALLQLLLRYGKKTQGWELFHWMLECFQVHSETKTKTCSLLDSMDKILEGVKVHSGTVDMMVTECFEEGRFKEGIETFYKAKAKMKSLNPLNYMNVITRCCEQGMLSEAERLFAELSSNTSLSAIDVSTHRAMMDAYVKAGRVEDALQMANKMVDAKLNSIALWMQI